jgi:hypothetical protein
MPRPRSPAKKRPIEVSARSRSLFLKSLAQDLAAAGFRIRRPRKRNDGWKFTPPSYHAQGIRLRALRTEQIASSSDFIRRMEAGNALMLLGDGRSIEPIRIQPQIKICASSGDHDIFRYAKLFQAVPTTNRVGRQIRCLVYDVGQSRPFLMGVFELTSGTYTLAAETIISVGAICPERPSKISVFAASWI